MINNTAYKYRTLNNCEDVRRLVKIINTGELWFSKFHKLNDPMEGLFYTCAANSAILDKIAINKSKCLICSFGSSNRNSQLWAYYANGYTGVCVEISLYDTWDSDSGKKLYKHIDYVSKSNFESPIHINDSDHISQVSYLLSRKRINWKSENEIRLLAFSENHDTNEIYTGQPVSLTVGCMADSNRVCAINDGLNISNNISWGIATPDGVESRLSYNDFRKKKKQYDDFRNSFALY